MADVIQLEIISSASGTIKADIKNLYIPAYLGEAGILHHHLPYISILNFGEISYDDLQDQTRYLYIEGGIIEVKDNKITIITDFIEKGENLVKDEVVSRLEELKKAIESSKKGEISAEELAQALEEEKRVKIKNQILEKMGV
jgi:F-type H+-transporting ATPase subunit epsilon